MFYFMTASDLQNSWTAKGLGASPIAARLETNRSDFRFCWTLVPLLVSLNRWMADLYFFKHPDRHTDYILTEIR